MAINGLNLGAIVSEISFFVKLLLYLQIVIFCSLYLDSKTFHQIINVNFWVYSLSISFGYLTGSGFNGYDTYEASKGFFNANNSTAIVGLTFGCYYYFIKRDIKRVLATIVVLFFTGSKVFLVMVAVMGFHLLKDFVLSLKNLKMRVLFYLVGIGVTTSFLVPLILEKLWEGKYKARVLMAFYHSSKEKLINGGYNFIIELYSYIAYTRAYKSAYVFDFLGDNLRYVFFGTGSYFTKNRLFGEPDHIENDLIDMLIMYGGFGLLFYLVFHWMLIAKTHNGARYLAIFILAYSILAGHYVYTPMSYTLAGVILGYYYNRKDD